MSFLGTVIFSALFIIGGYMAYKYITKPMEEEAEASKSWPYVMGKIIRSEMQTSFSDGKKMYASDIRYTYTVNGKEYVGTDVSQLDASTSLKSNIKKELKKYTKDKTVKVYYDPEFPDSSVLETGGSFWFWILTKLPFLFMLLGVWIFLGFFKSLIWGR